MEKRRISDSKPKIKLSSTDNYLFVKNVVQKHNLNTICQSGKCPNASECWENRTATFMILGNICTRNCKFCSVTSGKPLPPDSQEPYKLAESIKLMQLKHCVITSVDRDDLSDYGASHWVKVINEIKKTNINTTIEVLIPDFNGNLSLVKKIIEAQPNIISHNIETVKSLSKIIRPSADYQRSLKVLSYISHSGIAVKTGIMLGLGENYNEIEEVLKDLYEVGCRIITIGQYLQPSSLNVEVKKYYTDEEFINIKQMALSVGYKMVESSKLTRSSYHAEKHIV